MVMINLPWRKFYIGSCILFLDTHFIDHSTVQSLFLCVWVECFLYFECWSFSCTNIARFSKQHFMCKTCNVLINFFPLIYRLSVFKVYWMYDVDGRLLLRNCFCYIVVINIDKFCLNCFVGMKLWEYAHWIVFFSTTALFVLRYSSTPCIMLVNTAHY